MMSASSGDPAADVKEMDLGEQGGLADVANRVQEVSTALSAAVWQQDTLRISQGLDRCFSLLPCPVIRESPAFIRLRETLQTLCGHPALLIANKATILIRNWQNAVESQTAAAPVNDDKGSDNEDDRSDSGGSSQSNSDNNTQQQPQPLSAAPVQEETSVIKYEQPQMTARVPEEPKPHALDERSELRMWHGLHSLGLSDLTPTLIRAGLDLDSLQTVTDETLERSGLSMQDRFRVQYALRKTSWTPQMMMGAGMGGMPGPGPGPGPGPVPGQGGGQGQMSAQVPSQGQAPGPAAPEGGSQDMECLKQSNPGLAAFLQQPSMGMMGMGIGPMGPMGMMPPGMMPPGMMPPGMWPGMPVMPQMAKGREVRPLQGGISKKSAADKAAACQGFVCAVCGTTSTPQRRHGPARLKELCNACWLRWARTRRAKVCRTGEEGSPGTPNSTAENGPARVNSESSVNEAPPPSGGGSAGAGGGNGNGEGGTGDAFFDSAADAAAVLSALFAARGGSNGGTPTRGPSTPRGGATRSPRNFPSPRSKSLGVSAKLGAASKAASSPRGRPSPKPETGSGGDKDSWLNQFLFDSRSGGGTPGGTAGLNTPSTPGGISGSAGAGVAGNGLNGHSAGFLPDVAGIPSGGAV